MSFRKLESDSYCVERRHRSATKNIYGDIASKFCNFSNDFYSICKRKKTKTFSDNTVQAKDLVDFIKNSGKKGLNLSKEMAKNF